MTSRIAWCGLSIALLILSSPLRSQTVHTQEHSAIISLDRDFVAPAADAVPVRGEPSYANAPANFFAFHSTRRGELAPIEAVHLRFSAGTTLKSIKSTADFTIEPGGSCVEGRSYAKGDNCIVLVRFTPQGPGRRMGDLTIGHSGSDTPDGIGLGGYGYAPVLSFTPALITTVPGTYPSGKGLLSGANNLAIGGDTLYVADIGNNQVRKIDSTGTIVNISPFFATPASLAVDNFGEIWTANLSTGQYYFSEFSPFGSQTAWGVAYVDTTCTPSSPCSVLSVGMDEPAEINIDSNNNLFMEEATQGALEMPAGGYSGGNGTLNLWHLNDTYAYFLGPPSTFAIGPGDSLYTAFGYSYGSVCYIVEEPLYGAEGSSPNFTRVAGASNCGFSGDGGQGSNAEIGLSVGQIAFDLAGDLYFSDSDNQRVRMINGYNGIITTIAGNGTAGYNGDNNMAKAAKLSYPTGVAVDSQGQVFIISGTGTTSGGAQVIRKLGPNGELAFGSHVVGNTSSLKVTLTNTGNSDMVLTTVGFTGTDPHDYSIDATTTTCILTSGSYLNVGQSCQVTVNFKPAATGTRTANLVFYDNTVTNMNTVQLTGTGVASAPSFSPSSLSFPSTAVNQSSNSTVTVTNNGNANLTVSGITVGGTNPKMFTYTSTCTGQIAPKATCKLQVTFKPTTAGSHSAVLNIADNSPASPHSVSIAGTGLTQASSKVTVASSANPATGCAPVLFSVSVSGTPGKAPTGSVELKRGTAVLVSAPLTNGRALLSTPALAPGSNQLSADYSGDETYSSSASPIFTQMVASPGSCRGVEPLTLPETAQR